MKLYHGSRYIITEPAFGGGRKYNDYGSGFYCTESVEMAKKWTGRQKPGRDPKRG